MDAAEFGGALCIVCQEEKTTARCMFFPCAHAQCYDCLRQNVLTSTASQPFAPARCCTVISTDDLLGLGILSAAEVRAYCDRLEEMTSPQARLYCHDGNCATYIPVKAHGLRTGFCPACGLETCKTCLQKSHLGACSAKKLAEMAESTDAVLRLAAVQGWKRCPNCKNLVQKHGGCNELSCTCGQTFCYGCGQPRSHDHVCRAHDDGEATHA